MMLITWDEIRVRQKNEVNREFIIRHSLLITRRIVSKAHQAGLLASGSKRFSSRLPIPSRMVAFPKADEMLTSYSSATASVLHRLPYSAATLCHGHLMKTLCIVTFLSIPIGFLCCQRVEISLDGAYAFSLDWIHVTLSCIVWKNGSCVSPEK